MPAAPVEEALGTETQDLEATLGCECSLKREPEQSYINPLRAQASVEPRDPNTHAKKAPNNTKEGNKPSGPKLQLNVSFERSAVFYSRSCCIQNFSPPRPPAADRPPMPESAMPSPEAYEEKEVSEGVVMSLIRENVSRTASHKTARILDSTGDVS